jgi:glycerol-3-phosphate dehydrogenase
VVLELVHGGLRYLAHCELGLARESVRERAVPVAERVLAADLQTQPHGGS